MIDLDQEGDFVGVFAGHRTEDTVGRSHRIAATFDGQLHDVFGVEVNGVGGKGGARSMLDALVYGQDGEKAGVF